MRISVIVLLLLIALSPAAHGATAEGVVEGSLEPQGATARVSAVRDGTIVASVQAGMPDGKFSLALEEGTYTIILSAPVSSFPIRLENVSVKRGETTALPPLLIVQGSGKAVLFGTVLPPRADSEVVLLREGRERATVRPDKEGRYEFTGLPAGRYEVRATAPGHASETATVAVPENQRVSRSAVLFPIVETDGVDWVAGHIRATGIGSLPKGDRSPAQVRAMTRRAAVADGQRNLLRIIRQIKIDGSRSVGSLMSSSGVTERIRGYLRGYRIVSERMLEDGRIEVMLELPLTGPAGLSRAIAGK